MDSGPTDNIPLTATEGNCLTGLAAFRPQRIGQGVSFPCSRLVESRMGAVARDAFRFPSPLVGCGYQKPRPH